METQALERLKEQANSLTVDDQLRLASYLVERVRSSRPPTKPTRSWQELRGLYPYPMMDEDAQAWVSRTRHEGDANRMHQWQGQ